VQAATATTGASALVTGPRLARLALAALLLGAAGWVVLETERVAPPIEAGSPAPDFALPRLGGGEIALRELRGKVVLVNFWATWCAPCEQEMPAMQGLWEQLAPRGFELVAISVDADAGDVAAFRQRLALAFPIGLDPNRDVAEIYQSFRYPESFLIDRDGVLVARYIGERDWSAPEYVSRIERALSSD
jgi:peroxiredoxin